jgi:hypothetical protein
MGAQKDQKRINSNIYWSGAFIAFGIPFLGIEILGLFYGVSPSNSVLLQSYRFVILFLHIMGGMVGGYLVAQRSTVGWQQGGIVTGVMAYVLEQVVHTVLYGWNVIGDNFTMAGMILGSVLGAFIAEYMTNRIKDEEPQQGEELTY